MDINLTTLFNDFYHTRFFVVLCLGLFTFLFVLRLDNTLSFSYWLVFAPLWIWKVTALAGMIMGTVSWCRMSRRRFEGDTFIQYKAMLLSFTTNSLLFLFELIACEKLEASRNTPWSICFIPLYALSLISIGSCIWSIRYNRSYEIELFCSLNVLQFVFVSLRLDNTIIWSWMLVLIPVWILMCILFIILLYLVILTIIMSRSSHLANHHTRSSFRSNKQKWLSVLFYMMFVLSLVAFLILLASKLDQEMPPSMYGSSLYISSSSSFYMSAMNSQNNQFNKFMAKSSVTASTITTSSSPSIAFFSPFHQSSDHVSSNGTLSFFAVSLPLYFVYLALLCLSFNNHSGNTLWFGMKMDFCEVFLTFCPVCQTYGNVQFNLSKADLFPSLGPQHQGNTVFNGVSAYNTNTATSAVSGSPAATTHATVTFCEANLRKEQSLLVPATASSSKKSLGCATGRSSMDARSNHTSVLTYAHLISSRQAKNSSANNCTSLADLDTVDTDNPSVSILNPITINRQDISMGSSMNSKRAASGNRNQCDCSRNSKMLEDEEEEEAVAESSHLQSKNSGESNDGKYRQSSLRSFHSIYNSDRFSVKSCIVRNNGNGDGDGSGSNRKEDHELVVLTLDLPD